MIKYLSDLGVMYMIKVLLADDQELIRESLGFVLGAQGDITVVGMAKNGRDPKIPNRQNAAKPMSASRILLLAALFAWS